MKSNDLRSYRERALIHLFDCCRFILIERTCSSRRDLHEGNSGGLRGKAAIFAQEELKLELNKRKLLFQDETNTEIFGTFCN
ncbi:Hypothetical predicted protein [Podarcis lilfordi]|uniref:Uncharacterized protein n=1 Tax=Podarcis lilfordi TaxID=74358 RepID=A0AA35LNL4_9SAUR|nr:Hypothetical predicted protein [Podarcis lilfordi]